MQLLFLTLFHPSKRMEKHRHVACFHREATCSNPTQLVKCFTGVFICPSGKVPTENVCSVFFLCFQSVAPASLSSKTADWSGHTSASWKPFALELLKLDLPGSKLELPAIQLPGKVIYAGLGMHFDKMTERSPVMISTATWLGSNSVLNIRLTSTFHVDSIIFCWNVSAAGYEEYNPTRCLINWRRIK